MINHAVLMINIIIIANNPVNSYFKIILTVPITQPVPCVCARQVLTNRIKMGFPFKQRNKH
jgi:hypothetical protein